MHRWITIARRAARAGCRAAARAAPGLAALTLACASPGPSNGPDSSSAAIEAPRGPGGEPPASDGALPQAPVALELDRTQYAAGGTVNMRLVSRGSQPYGYNPCTRTVEQRSRERWVPVAEPDRICTMELRLLAPGETALATTELPDALEAGEYRLALALTQEGSPPDDGAPGRVRATSAAFRVR